MANLRANNLTGTGGRNAIDGSVFFELGDRLQVPSSTYSTNFNLGGDFTIEGWVKPSIFTSYPSILHLDDSTNSKDLYINFRNGATLGITNDSTVFATSPSFTLNEWAHFAVVRNSNSVTVYCNGVGGSSASCTTDFGAGNQNLYIGMISALSASDRYRGYMSNLRIVKGTALYTANFTPPTEKLTAVDGTILLCCQDSDDPTQEATGKTITGVGGLDYSLRDYNLITNGNFDYSTVTGWTLASGSRSLGTGQSGTFGDGNHLVLTGGSMYQAFTTVIGRTYFVNCQSNGSDSSYISTTTSAGAAIITDIRSSPQVGSGVRGQKSFVATQTTYYVILAGGGTGNFDTVSVYEAESPKAPKFLPPYGIDAGVTFDGGIKKNTQGYMYFPTGDTAQRGRGRGIFAGGYCPNNTEVIQYIEIQSMSNTIDFGDLSNKYRAVGGFGSNTRGVFSGGAGGSPTGSTLTNTMEYVTISNTANALDFGDMLAAGRNVDGCSNSTRGILFGGQLPSGNQNIIQYSTIATTGNTTDFGDIAREEANGTAFASSTRAIHAGGFDTSAADNVIEYVTIATTGNATNFGDLLGLYAQQASVASSTRGVVCTGSIGPTPSNNSNVIQYVTIASTGDSVDFGDYVTVGENVRGVTNSLRGVFAGGYCPSYVNTMNYITITTTGNSSDFGDISNGQTSPNTGLSQAGNASDSHGGLS